MNYKYKIKKGDKVVIATGKDRGKVGTVSMVDKNNGKAVVEGVNIYKKHAKPSQQYPQGGIIDIPKPVDISNLRLICPGCEKATRVSYKNKGKDKRRFCIKCSEVINAA